MTQNPDGRLEPVDEDAREIGAVGPAPSVRLMEAVSQYLGAMKDNEGVNGQPIASWLNRSRGDEAQHRQRCEDFAGDLLDLVNRLRAWRWLKFLTSEVGEGVRRGEAATGEARIEFALDHVARANAYRGLAPLSIQRVYELMLSEIRKNGDPKHNTPQACAVLRSVERSVMDEADGRPFAEVVKENAFNAYQALADRDVESLLAQAVAEIDAPSTDATRGVIAEFLDPAEEPGVQGCLTREMRVRIFLQYRVLAGHLVGPELFDEARAARKRIVDGAGKVPVLTSRQLCADLARMAALADPLRETVCADASASHRAAVRLLLENLSALGRLATLCLESAALLATDRPAYGSARREAETSEVDTAVGQAPSTPAASLWRIFDEADKSLGRTAMEGSAADRAVQNLRGAADRLKNSPASVAEIAEELLNVLDGLDEMIAEPGSAQVHAPTIHRVRRLLLIFVQEYSGIEEYRIKTGELAIDHSMNYKTRNFAGTTKIATVVKPGYWQPSKKRMLRKPVVDLS